MDLRLTKDVQAVGSLKVSLIGEVYNLFNRANYGSYNTSLSATNAAQTAVFGQPQQNLGNAYVPREGQLAFRHFVLRCASGAHDIANDRQRPAATARRSASVTALRYRRQRVRCSATALRIARAPAATDAHVRSTPENVVFGWFPIDRQPVLRVASGSVVRIDTLSQRGTTQQEDPVTFLGALGVKPDEILQDVRDVWACQSGRPQDARAAAATCPHRTRFTSKARRPATRWRSRCSN